MRWLKTYPKDVVAIGILALIVAAFYSPIWLHGQWLPKGGGDAVSFLYPMYRFIAAIYANGEIPLWNPHQYAGYPLIADNQAGMFYPPHVLLFLLKPDFGYGWLMLSVAFHIFWAGLGFYLCARGWYWRERIRPIPAAIGATVFMLSSLFIVHQGNLNLNAVASWIPWALGAARQVFSKQYSVNSKQSLPTANWLLLTGLIIGISTLAGHGQMTFFMALILGMYALWAFAVERNWWALPQLALMGAIGIGVAAVTIFPSFALNELTRRGAFTYAESVNYSIPLKGLVGLIAPDFFGRNASTFWGNFPRIEYGYVGLLPLLLILSGQWKGQRSKDYSGWFFLLAGLFFMLLALGGSTPVHRWVFEPLALPFQVPARFVVLANLCMAMLVVFALDGVSRQKPNHQWPKFNWAMLVFFALLLVVGQVLLVRYSDLIPFDRAREQPLSVMLKFGLFAVLSWGALVLQRWLPNSAWLSMVWAVLVLNLFAYGQYSEVEYSNPIEGFGRTAAIEFLQGEAGINRIDEATGLWQPSAAQTVGLYSAGGVFNPLSLSNYVTYNGAVGYRGSPQYSLLGIKYIVADKSEPPGDTAFIKPVFDGDANVSVWLNTNARPRAQLYYESIVVASDEDAFGRLHGDIDLQKTIILKNGETISSADGEGTIGVIEYGANRLAFDVTTNRRAYFFLSDIYYPHWVATVDGVEAEIVSANYAFRAVLIEPGTHRLEMSFEPPSWRWGWMTSVATLVAVLLGFVLTKRQSLGE